MIYVDTLKARFGRTKTCHLIADTDTELHAMAEKIGVARRWHQNPGNDSHYLLTAAKRSEAVAAGALGVGWRVAACMSARRRKIGFLGHPYDAETWARDQFKKTIKKAG